MNVVRLATIKRYAAFHADAAAELFRWHKTAKRSVWRDLNEVRLSFPDADHVGRFLMFNFRRGHYRLIVKVDYRAKLLMVKWFLSHDEDMRGNWKQWARQPSTTRNTRVF